VNAAHDTHRRDPAPSVSVFDALLCVALLFANRYSHLHSTATGTHPTAENQRLLIDGALCSRFTSWLQSTFRAGVEARAVASWIIHLVIDDIEIHDAARDSLALAIADLVEADDILQYAELGSDDPVVTRATSRFADWASEQGDAAADLTSLAHRVGALGLTGLVAICEAPRNRDPASVLSVHLAVHDTQDNATTPL